MATSREMTAGPALPLIFNFTMPLLLGNLLQQTYSLVDAAIVGKFLGINALAAVGASSSVIFLILGFCTIFYPVLSVHWEIVKHRFGFCSFRLYSILSWTFSVFWY